MYLFAVLSHSLACCSPMIQSEFGLDVCESDFYFFSGPEVLFQDLHRDEIYG